MLFRSSNKLRVRMLSSIAENFAKAQAAINNPAIKRDVSNDIKLQLYGLFKQAEVGQCASARPEIFDPVGRAKFDAWYALGNMSMDDAKKKYVDVVTTIFDGKLPDIPVASTVDELDRLYPKWTAKGMTWNDFGGCTQSDLKGLIKKWLTDPEDQAILQGIWNRHPLRLLDLTPSRDDLKEIRQALDRQERNSSGYVEDRVRDRAGDMFGFSTMKTFLAKCLYDLIILSNPHEYSHEDIVAGEGKLEQFAKDHFVGFVTAYYEHLKDKVDDPSHVLLKNPWVVDGSVVAENLKACGGVLSNSQRDLLKRIQKATETEDGVMSVYRRSAGPGLSIVVWCACGEFLGEVVLDCRGKVDLLLTTRRAVVMGAEIKTSATAIPAAKKQLIRRFKIIAKCLEVTHGIGTSSCIFIGRVFFRNSDESSVVAEAEDGAGNDLGTLSFYYNRV